MTHCACVPKVHVHFNAPINTFSNSSVLLEIVTKFRHHVNYSTGCSGASSSRQLQLSKKPTNKENYVVS
ncbi:hypothetical protein V1477_018768 [Vespula maculifrons]|uniref:Uncharacterized protein n=1 Tax=Vespula maculifrons TaxID=7453 RepID=A0ABD2AWB0_VESMC